MFRALSFNVWTALIVSSLILLGGYLYFESYQRQSEITTNLLVVERSLNAVNNVQTEIQKLIRDKRGYQFSGNPAFFENVKVSGEIIKTQIDGIDVTFPNVVGVNLYDDWVLSVDSLMSKISRQMALVQTMGTLGSRPIILSEEQRVIALVENLDSAYRGVYVSLADQSYALEAAYRQYQRQNLYGFLILVGSSLVLMGIGSYLAQNHIRNTARIEADKIRLNMLNEREAATQAERNRLEFVLEGTKAGLWEWNVQTGETVFDERWAALIGYRLDELTPVNIETWVKFTHPDDLALAKERLDACFRRETDLYECEFRMKHKAGHWVWILDRGSVKSWTADGKPERMFGTHIDVSEAKKNALAMAEKERMYRGIFNSSYQFMALLDPSGKVIEMNDSGLQYSGLQPADIKGKLLWECDCWFDDGASHLAVKSIVDQSQHDQVNQEEVQVVDTSGKPKTVLFSAKPIRDESGTLESITVEGRIIQDIVDARQALIHKNEELDKFASVASHDMKEPLRMIASFMQLLEKNFGPQLDDKARQYIHFAVDGAKRMTNLINELLSYARVTRDMRNVEIVDLNDILNDVTGLLRDVIRENGAVVKIDPLPTLKGYPVALRTLFTNVLSNGIKYQPPGQAAMIQISSDDLGDYWEIRITDNGIGIADEYHEEIFKLFKRLHTNDQYQGTGLGLSTCKRIVEEHGGSMSVISKEHMGSTFVLKLPK